MLDGSFEYQPDTGYVGTDTFTYTATNVLNIQHRDGDGHRGRRCARSLSMTAIRSSRTRTLSVDVASRCVGQ